MRSKPKSKSITLSCPVKSKSLSWTSLPSYSRNVLLIIVVAIAFANWKGCKNYRCLLATQIFTKEVRKIFYRVTQKNGENLQLA